jgi:hypothetical protein
LKLRNSEEELIDVARGRELVKENAQLTIAIGEIRFEAAEKEKSLVESINILEAENAGLLEQIAAFQKPAADEVFNQDVQKKSEDAYASLTNGIISSAESESESEPKLEAEPDLEPEIFGGVNKEKIRKSNFIWKSVADKVYSLEPNFEFQVHQLFDPAVWSSYNEAQKRAILEIFEEHYERGQYVNIKHIDAQFIDESVGCTYVTLPFLELPEWKKMTDKVMLFLNSKEDGASPSEIIRALGLRGELVRGCLDYLVQTNFVEAFYRAGSFSNKPEYRASVAGKFYAEALDV